MLNWASDPYGLVFSITVSWGSLIFCFGHSIDTRTVSFGRFDSFLVGRTEIECAQGLGLPKWPINQLKLVL